MNLKASLLCTTRLSLPLLGACSLVALACPQLAFAQVVSEPASAAADTRGIGDIIVTAQRRSENVQKSSVSIAVLSSEEIAKGGVTQARDLAAVVPGVQIAQGGAATQIYIRGVGDFGSTGQTNPAVAFNVDGVYVARPAGIEGNFFDVERVEVLKGPQGTLYGRNATGGAINVITNKPKLGERSIAGSIEAGNYDKIGGEAAVNIPIGDSFAIRAAAQVIHRAPYATQNFGDDIHQSARLQALWKADDRLTVRLAGDYIHVGGGGAEYVLIQHDAAGVNSPYLSVTDPRATAYYDQRAVAAGLCAPRGAPFPTSPGNLVAYSGACPNLVIPAGPVAGTYSQAQLTQPFTGRRGRTDNQFWSVSGQLDYDLDFATFTLLSAYRHAQLDYDTYPGGFLFDISADGVPETSKATSVEARLGHDASKFKWVAGLYYFNEDQFGLANVDAGFVQKILVAQSLSTKSYAAFGQATYSLTDRLRVIGGIRYTDDKKNGNPITYQLNGAGGFYAALAAGCTPAQVAGTSFIGCQSSNLVGDQKFHKVNWKGGVEFDLAPQNMVYATVSTGYKAGGFYAGVAPGGVAGQAATYKPETLFAIEGGTRNRFLDNTLQINVEGFYYKYKNHQEPVITVDGVGQIVQAQFNAGRGRVYGGSVDMVFKPSQNDTLHGSVEYLNTKYSSFIYQSPIIPGQPLFVPPGASGCNVTNSAVTQTIDCSGFPLTRSPKWAGMASYSHVFVIPGGGDIEAEGNMQFTAKRYLATDYLPESLDGAYQIYNASLTYHAPAANWSLSAFVRNITDKSYYTGANRSSFVTQFSSASISAPRTYGARLNFNF